MMDCSPPNPWDKIILSSFRCFWYFCGRNMKAKIESYFVFCCHLSLNQDFQRCPCLLLNSRMLDYAWESKTLRGGASPKHMRTGTRNPVFFLSLKNSLAVSYVYIKNFIMFIPIPHLNTVSHYSLLSSLVCDSLINHGACRHIWKAN